MTTELFFLTEIHYKAKKCSYVTTRGVRLVVYPVWRGGIRVLVGGKVGCTPVQAGKVPQFWGIPQSW